MVEVWNANGDKLKIVKYLLAELAYLLWELSYAASHMGLYEA